VAEGSDREGRSLKITPNPVRDRLSFVLPNKTPDAVRIYSIDGRLVKEFPVRDETALTLDVSGLRPGVYLLKAGDLTESFVIAR